MFLNIDYKKDYLVWIFYSITKNFFCRFLVCNLDMEELILCLHQVNIQILLFIKFHKKCKIYSFPCVDIMKKITLITAI